MDCGLLVDNSVVLQTSCCPSTGMHHVGIQGAAIWTSSTVRTSDPPTIYRNLSAVSTLFYSQWRDAESTRYCRHYWPIVPAPDDRWWVWISRWNKDWQGKPKYSEKTCPSATLSTTNPPWTDSSSNPDRRGGKSATNRMSYGEATVSAYVAGMGTDAWAAAANVSRWI
jgi:hypothetical protein